MRSPYIFYFFFLQEGKRSVGTKGHAQFHPGTAEI